MSGFQTPQTVGPGTYWPKVAQWIALTFCLLPTTRLDIGDLDADRVPDASRPFKLMRSLGGAIGPALIDTVIYVRSRVHVAHLRARLQTGDP